MRFFLSEIVENSMNFYILQQSFTKQKNLKQNKNKIKNIE